MNSLKLKSLALALIAGALHGCASEPAPYVESHMGEAVKQAQLRQTMHPEASKNTDPVTGIDGQAAQEAVDRYHKSFQAPPPSFTVINVNGPTAK
jgi:cytochrome c556